MKDFSGVIVITDPMYVSKSEDWMENNGFNVSKYRINNIDNCMISSTGIGRINSDVFKIENIKEFFQNQKEYLNSCIKKQYNSYMSGTDIKPRIGSISSDSGYYGVFYKEDIEKYNPEWSNQYNHLELDFKGKVGVYTDSYGQNHLYGIGNINFYTL